MTTIEILVKILNIFIGFTFSSAFLLLWINIFSYPLGNRERKTYKFERLLQDFKKYPRNWLKYAYVFYAMAFFGGSIIIFNLIDAIGNPPDSGLFLVMPPAFCAFFSASYFIEGRSKSLLVRYAYKAKIELITLKQEQGIELTQEEQQIDREDFFKVDL